ncbi:class A beta-lactamase-related serine hydrolase [Corynebacterium cystitidis]|uniref:Beta-lactamase n=1 Tax=Corynebacterium cystitidis DSM 20524 TaxID=1121357 RepID=A0A1H9TWL0_9CORY|nr:class A beta-lactamase-related serine hydrolase [Corynebacterium cystitidis]SES01421.1 hypothetical protein SAMN05661109_01587 [Corynebacterium cystitidis DSM 20524]SNV82042.1 putative secreted protein [Corynebacterium cystitidis]
MMRRQILSATSALVLVGTLNSSCTIGDPETTSVLNDESSTVNHTPTTAVPPSTSGPLPYPGDDYLTAELQGVVDGVVAKYGGAAALPVSDGTAENVGGEDVAFPAWSTIKVPIAIAALRQDPSMSATAMDAITSSDKAAAEALWATVAPSQVEAVLAEASVPITVCVYPKAPPRFLHVLSNVVVAVAAGATRREPAACTGRAARARHDGPDSSGPGLWYRTVARRVF